MSAELQLSCGLLGQPSANHFMVYSRILIKLYQEHRFQIFKTTKKAGVKFN